MATFGLLRVAVLGFGFRWKGLGLADNLNAHRASGTFNHASCMLRVRCVEVFLFELNDFENLLARDFTNFVTVRDSSTRLNFSSLL
jgi:hypothetical protein